jgi:hypothetical protein
MDTQEFITTYVQKACTYFRPPAKSFTMEITESPVPFINGIEVPRVMGFSTWAYRFETTGMRKTYRGAFCYDRSARGFRVWFNACIFKVYEELGAREGDSLIFSRIAVDETREVVRIRVTKQRRMIIDDEEVNSPTAPRDLTLAAAHRFVKDEAFSTEHVHQLINAMDYDELSTFFERMLTFVEEDITGFVWKHWESVYAIMCAFLFTAPTPHMGFVMICAHLFNVSAVWEPATYGQLDYMMFNIALHLDPTTLCPQLVPHCQIRTMRRFPRTCLKLLTIEVRQSYVMPMRKYKILDILTNRDAIEAEDGFLLLTVDNVFKEFEQEHACIVNTVQTMIRTGTCTSCSSQSTGHTFRSSSHLY